LGAHQEPSSFLHLDQTKKQQINPSPKIMYSPPLLVLLHEARTRWSIIQSCLSFPHRPSSSPSPSPPPKIDAQGQF
jgi:hypothetical protein